MEKLRDWKNRLPKMLQMILFPHIVLWVLIIPVAMVMVIYALAVGFEPEWLTYAAYGLSAYALVIFCVRLPFVIENIRRFKAENRHVQRYFSEKQLQVKISLYTGLFINLLLMLMQLISGHLSHSVWYYALAGYYGLLAVMRYYLLRDTKRIELGEDRVSEWRDYRFCGVVMVFVNLVLGVIVSFIVWQNRGMVHSEIFTIAMAASTFLSIVTAVMSVLKNRRHESPLVTAEKSIGFTAALVSLLSLETSMLTAFGEESDALFRMIITGSTGAVICVLVLATAVYMILRGTKEIKQMNIGENR